MILAVSAKNLSSGERLSSLFILNEAPYPLPLDLYDDSSLEAIVIVGFLNVSHEEEHLQDVNMLLCYQVFSYELLKVHLCRNGTL